MIKIYPIAFLILTSLGACNNVIKNPETKNTTDLAATDSKAVSNKIPKANSNLIMQSREDLIGYWVGYFENANDTDTRNVHVYGESLIWDGANKINICIDTIQGDLVSGHSIDAGLARNFRGTMKEENNRYVFELKEPGENKYDGSFHFSIPKNDSVISGTWDAFHEISIPRRKYSLQKKPFRYRPEQMLDNSERHFGNWDKPKRPKKMDAESEEFEDVYAAATDAIYQLNASDHLLMKEDVENLKKGDLIIIRNTIYARHGYSFKIRPLRVFFDAQPWYVPVSTAIQPELSEIEKKNILLLMKYEKNAKEYYDTFGR